MTLTCLRTLLVVQFFSTILAITPAEFVRSMGVGINIGNTLDVRPTPLTSAPRVF
jgi:hypothetical protein